MKKIFLIPLFVIFVVIIIFALLPVSFISANPVNLVANGDFSEGGNNWDTLGSNVSFTDTPGEALLGPDAYAYIHQHIYTSRKDLKMSFDIYPTTYGTNAFYSEIRLYKGGGYINWAYDGYFPGDLPLTEWTTVSFYISDFWYDFWTDSIPDFDEIIIWFEADLGATAYFDNVMLTYEDAQYVEPVWVRDTQMKCKAVWINQDNNFQLSFIYPYANNNWVKIYDMGGKEVYSMDMPYDNPNIIVELPDGMYKVQTFHDQIEPIQEFVIGKP